ncbi:multidrug effflux MFS transporter [Amycolatopsis sp. K13G38]|uniref:Multidrug effflux MFS transporter n=1 Tax=Amycolatopsis acididurans TaxID=2724524 RepID=A0ABX1JAB1_9PSEU|nr:multidrug effflux MFS transporter [Amycolatopsis acididurans]
MLAGLSSVAPFATDMYVPGFPAMADSPHTDSANVQLSMTTFLVGLALGQILFGPVSDSLGRRPVLLAGSAAFVVFSVACAVAPNVEVLIAARRRHRHRRLARRVRGAARARRVRCCAGVAARGPAARRRYRRDLPGHGGAAREAGDDRVRRGRLLRGVSRCSATSPVRRSCSRISTVPRKRSTA